MSFNFAMEFEFDLPKGLPDAQGELHRHGTMRLATAADEILPLQDPRVVKNPGYLTILLLSRVVTNLGTLPKIDAHVIERLFSEDLAFLQDMYQRINNSERTFTVVCPQCGQVIEEPVNFTQAE